MIVLGLGLAGYAGYTQLAGLQHQTGVQWDREMRGPWVRESSPQKSGVEMYRIHIKNQAEETLSAEQRLFHRGDKVVAAFHFRTQRPGRFQPRVVVTGPTAINPPVRPTLQIRGAGFSEFKATLLPFVIPQDSQTGSYVLRIEVEDEQGRKGFWETDFEVD